MLVLKKVLKKYFNMLSKHEFGEFRYPLRSCNKCLVLEYCHLKDDILSETKIVCDYAKYGCVKYKCVEVKSKETDSVVSHTILKLLTSSDIVSYWDILEYFPNLSTEHFRSVISSYRKKGFKILVVSRNTYQLVK